MNKSRFLLLIPIITFISLAAALFTTITAHADPTWTPTPTSTPTATPTATPTPPAAFTWAVSPIEPETDITDALETLLSGDPPEGTTTLWAITDAAASPDGWYFSLSSLDGVPSPYDEWNVLDHSVWIGSAECIEDVTWACEFYDPDLPEIGGTLMFPWKVGESAIYGYAGVHDGGWGTTYAVDFFPATDETYAAEMGLVTWVCDIGTANTGVLIHGPSGDLLYLHLTMDNPLEVGDSIRQGDLVGNLVHGNFSDLCGHADQSAVNAHVHFGFDEENYLSIGGCVLNITTEIFDCNGEIYGVLESLPNTGESSGDVDPDDPFFSTGEPSIWNSIVMAVIDLFKGNEIAHYLPDHDPRIDFYFGRANVIMMIVTSFIQNIILGPAGLGTYTMIQAISVVIGAETIYWAADVLLSISPGKRKILKLLSNLW